MAHELAHVLLRHGTANATKAQGAQIMARAGYEHPFKLAGRRVEQLDQVRSDERVR